VSCWPSGLAGGLFAVAHGFASLDEVYWTTSGTAVMMVVLGGIGTLWGAVIGAALVVELEDYLATAGFEEIGIITGAIFVAIVLLFRRGMWGTAAARLAPRRHAPGSGADPAVEDRPQPASR